MDRWDWMAIRAYVPAAFGLVAALVLTWLISGLQVSLNLPDVFSAARWLPMAVFALAIAHGSWTTFRLWRAHHGEGLLCECGGLLGHEREGRYGPYRRCLACERNVAQRHYE